MYKIAKMLIVVSIFTTLTACTGTIQNRKGNCSYDYLFHPEISISRILGGCGPSVDVDAK